MARILVVDDETILVDVLSSFLSAHGHSVVALTDSRQAADLLNSREPLDLLISDIRMTPIDGIELLRLSRKVRPAMPVIMITAYNSRDILRQTAQLGALACVSKPFLPSEMLDRVNKALATPPSNRGNRNPADKGEKT